MVYRLFVLFLVDGTEKWVVHGDYGNVPRMVGFVKDLCKNPSVRDLRVEELY